ncbi:MAG TPA: hypothetical protein VNA89_05075, partial [Gemmatimonadaceae bacterium]|nr:hypothetical protein [Gemmatimonadaceae bacterium]
PAPSLLPLRPSRTALGPALALLLALAAAPVTLSAQRREYYDQTYLPADHNWAFRRAHPTADRIFNLFDYGHARLYELLLTRGERAAPALDAEVELITGELLAAPPALPLEESAIAPRFIRLAPEAQAMFDWAHKLHRHLYDVLADDRIPPDERDARVAEVLRYYKSRPDLAFSSTPKSMVLMEGQPYSLALRRRSPAYVGLVWSYHWMQMATYDAMLAARSAAERRALVDTAVGRFRAMVAAPTRALPTVMPMTPAIAPRFAARYPEASVVFDNMHALHDVVGDILADPAIPRRAKRAAILRAAAAYRDSTTSVTSLDEWRAHARAMGVAAMGGLAPGSSDRAAPASDTPEGHEHHPGLPPGG